MNSEKMCEDLFLRFLSPSAPSNKPFCFIFRFLIPYSSLPHLSPNIHSGGVPNASHPFQTSLRTSSSPLPTSGNSSNNPTRLVSSTVLVPRPSFGAPLPVSTSKRFPAYPTPLKS